MLLYCPLAFSQVSILIPLGEWFPGILIINKVNFSPFRFLCPNDVIDSLSELESYVLSLRDDDTCLTPSAFLFPNRLSHIYCRFFLDIFLTLCMFVPQIWQLINGGMLLDSLTKWTSSSLGSPPSSSIRADVASVDLQMLVLFAKSNVRSGFCSDHLWNLLHVYHRRFYLL